MKDTKKNVDYLSSAFIASLYKMRFI